MKCMPVTRIGCAVCGVGGDATWKYMCMVHMAGKVMMEKKSVNSTLWYTAGDYGSNRRCKWNVKTKH